MGVTTSGGHTPYCLRDGTGGEYPPGVAETDGWFIITKRHSTTGGCMSNKMDGSTGDAIRRKITDILELNEKKPVHIMVIAKIIGVKEHLIFEALCNDHGFQMDGVGRVRLPKTGR